MYSQVSQEIFFILKRVAHKMHILRRKKRNFLYFVHCMGICFSFSANLIRGRKGKIYSIQRKRKDIIKTIDQQKEYFSLQEVFLLSLLRVSGVALIIWDEKSLLNCVSVCWTSDSACILYKNDTRKQLYEGKTFLWHCHPLQSFIYLILIKHKRWVEGCCCIRCLL